EVGVRVGRAHEPPAPARKEHPGPVDVDVVVAALELLRQLGDDPELFGVRTHRLELGGGCQVRHRVEQPRQRLRRARGEPDDLAGGDDAVVDDVVDLGEGPGAYDL